MKEKSICMAHTRAEERKRKKKGDAEDTERQKVCYRK